MAQLTSNVEWKKWGEEDPLFGVATWKDKQKGGRSPWTDEEFYAQGELDWRDFLAQWQLYGVRPGSCLEVGCGAGRITKQLSATFDRVYAVDVSEGMIRKAQQAVGPNVEFALIDGIHLPQGESTVEAVFSTHVLQHLNTVEIGYQYFEEFRRVLKPGGSLMVHLPIYMLPPILGRHAQAVMRSTHRTAHWLSGVLASLRRMRGVQMMRGTPYHLYELHPRLKLIGFNRLEYRIFPVTSDGKLHPFVFATK